jgi:hypothetical protein
MRFRNANEIIVEIIAWIWSIAVLALVAFCTYKILMLWSE